MTTRRHIVALSGGKDSTAMALRLAEVEPQDYTYLCTPTGNEMPEMVEHWKRLGDMLGSRILPVTTGVSLQSEIERQKCLPNHRMRWCTRKLKIEPFQRYLLNASPATCYVGIRADEMDREGVDHEAIGDGIINRYPLVEWGWGIADVLGYLDERGVEIPERTDCAMCFFQRLGEWWRLWKNYPDLYAEAEELEAMVGHTLRSDSRDTWPAGLAGLRREFENGRVPRGATAPMPTSTRSRMCSYCSR